MRWAVSRERGKLEKCSSWNRKSEKGKTGQILNNSLKNSNAQQKSSRKRSKLFSVWANKCSRTKKPDQLQGSSQADSGLHKAIFILPTRLLKQSPVKVSLVQPQQTFSCASLQRVVLIWLSPQL